MLPSLAKLTVNTEAPRCEWPLEGARGNVEWNEEWKKKTADEVPPELEVAQQAFNELLLKIAEGGELTEAEQLRYVRLDDEIQRLRFYSSHMAIRVRRDGNCFYHALATLLRVPSIPGMAPDGSEVPNPYANLPKTMNGVVLRAQVMGHMQREWEHFGSDNQLAGELRGYVKRETDEDFAERHKVAWTNKILHPDAESFCKFLEEEVGVEREPPRDLSKREVVDFYVKRYGRLGDFAGQCEADAAAELFNVHIIMLMLNVDPTNPTTGEAEEKVDNPEWLQAWGEAWPCKKNTDGSWAKRTPEEIAERKARFEAANEANSPTANDPIRDDYYGGEGEYVPLSVDEAKALPTLIMVRHFPDNDPRYDGDTGMGVSEAPHFSPIIPKDGVPAVVRNVPACSLDRVRDAERRSRAEYVDNVRMYAQASGRLPSDEEMLRVGCAIGYCSDVDPSVRDMVLNFIARDIFGMKRGGQGTKRRLGKGSSSEGASSDQGGGGSGSGQSPQQPLSDRSLGKQRMS